MLFYVHGKHLWSCRDGQLTYPHFSWTTVHTNRKNEIAVQAQLQLDARNAEMWSKQNKMYLNYDKTTCMLMGMQYRTQNS